MTKLMTTMLVALGLATAGWVALPALADDNQASQDDQGETNAWGDSSDRRSPREAKRDAAQHIRDQRQAGVHDTISDYRSCVKAAVADHRFEQGSEPDNSTADANQSSADTSLREDLQACKQRFHGQVREVNIRARDQYQLAKERVRMHYADRLADAREDRADNQQKCKQSEACIERHIHHWEKRLVRAEAHLADLESRLNETQQELEDKRSSGNATKGELYRLQDKVFALKIKVLQTERMIFHIEVKIEHWEQALERLHNDQDPGTDAAGQPSGSEPDDAGDGNESDQTDATSVDDSA